MQLFKNGVVLESPLAEHELSFDTPRVAPRCTRREQGRAFALSTSTLLGTDEFDRDYLGQMPEVYRSGRGCRQ